MILFKHQAQILSPIAAYLSVVKKTVGISRYNWQPTFIEDEADCYQPSYELVDVINYNDLTVKDSQKVTLSLQLTEAKPAYFRGQSITSNLVRMTLSAKAGQNLTANRDAAIALLAYGLANKELVFPSLSYCGDLALIARSALTTLGQNNIIVGSATLRLSLATSVHADQS